MNSRKQWALRVAGATAVVLAIIAVYLWVMLVAPFGYQYPEAYYPPKDSAAMEVGDPQRVFVYGTLRYRLVRGLIIRGASDPRPAVLKGYKRQGLDIQPQPGASVEGLLLTVNAGQLRRLDRYERLGVRYEREQVRLEDGTLAWVYRRR